MIKNYSYLFLLLFISTFCFGQDCTATISYAGTPFCTSEGVQTVTLNGTGSYTGGTFTAPPGLNINASTGAITPSSSTAGTYTVTYTIPASGGCAAAVSVTTSVAITLSATASISYASSAFCEKSGNYDIALSGTVDYTGGTYTASPAGLIIDPDTGRINTGGSTDPGTYMVTYTIPARGVCPAVTSTTSVTITAKPTAIITYAGTPFCTSVATEQNVTLTGTAAYTGGTFSAPNGLSINPTTGAITPSTSTAGIYTVTYAIPASGGCAGKNVTTSVTITALPTAVISYAGAPFCTSVTTGQNVTLSGTAAYTGGTFAAIPSGLTISPTSGTITPSTSAAGTYTITYTTLASGGCAAVSVTTSVTITKAPTATISYIGTPFCKSIVGVQSATLNGTAAYTGGIFSAPAGLYINAATGDITPSASTAGTYTITYTIPANGGCAAIPVTTSVTITTIPTAVISYAGIPLCTAVTTGQNVTLSGTGAYTGGTYSAAPAGLTINPSTGAITPSTSTAGTYTITYAIPASGGCAAVSVTTGVTITTAPTATISYVGTPFCKSIAGAQSVTLIGTGAYAGGSFSSSPVGLSIDATTGELTPSSSTAGTYTITYTIPASNDCIAIPITTSITITDIPIATISYAETPFCKSLGTKNVTLIGSGAYAGGSYAASPAGLTIDALTGTITPSTSTVGTYTVTYTIPTSGGCAAVPVTTTVIIVPDPVGGLVSLSNSSIISSGTECFTASGTLYLSGHVGNIIKWQSSVSAGTSWVDIANTNNTLNYSGITQSTIFRAVIENGGCSSVISNSCVVYVIPNVKPSPVTVSASTICVGESLVLSATSGYATNMGLSTGGTFDGPIPLRWYVDGCADCLSSGGNNDIPGPWQLNSSNGNTYSGVDYTSIGKFAIAHGEGITSYMYTPVFNTFGLTNATLTFKHAYNFLAGARGEIQISVDGGSTYTTIQTYTGTLSPTDPFTAPANVAAVDLNAYLGQGNLKIRFYYYGIDTIPVNPNGSSWAIDNIAIPDVPTALNTQWADAATGVVVGSGDAITVTPSVTTTYAVTSSLNGCNSFGTDGTAYVTATVNPRPTAVINQNQTVCNGGTATFSVALTGTGPWELTYFDGTTSTTVTDILTSPYVFTVADMTNTETYTITYLKDSICTSIASDITGSATVTVLSGTAGLWTGLVSSDWFDSMNWACGLPSATIDAVIPAGTARMPVIDPSSSFATTNGPIAVARDVIIAANASITMVANSDLHVTRDWRNSGSFSPGMGTVTFNGATTDQIQLINSGISLNETFYNLTLNCTNGAKGINVADAFQLTVANNLLLTNGDLRLTGEAQLIQNGTSANPSGGTGVLLRDQQGTKSSYHYNYWSSPVSPDNLSYTIGGVLKDGTNADATPFNQDPINFGWGYDFADGPLTSPIKISNRWLYKYTMVSTSYYSWQLIESTGSVKVGEGFTMKGVTGLEPVTNYQNYVFAGKPNNGDINLTIAPNQLYLIGNPYPSALDADEFIKDNILDGGRATSNVFNGALYFWDHFGGTTHNLSQYVGGYAIYNLMGGVAAVSSDPMINNNNASGSKEPKRYIPVAQGFFIRTDLAGATVMLNPISGGTVTFKNSQRAFKTESSLNSLFIRNENQTVDSGIDNRQRIRLSFESPSGLRRQLLVGADPNTTNFFDLGYDAPMLDINPDDMYWDFGNGKFVIQGIPDFNVDQVIPLGLTVSAAGTTKIKIDELENIPSSTEIYLFDSLTGTYFDIKNQDFISDLPVGEYNSRFSLRFTNETLNIEDIIQNNNIMVFTDDNHILNIKNNLLDTRIESVRLFNILGQSITKWNVENEDQHNIKISVEHIRSGAYIVKLKTSKGTLNKKVRIR